MSCFFPTPLLFQMLNCLDILHTTYVLSSKELANLKPPVPVPGSPRLLRNKQYGHSELCSYSPSFAGRQGSAAADPLAGIFKPALFAPPAPHA
jgi:hypothetical protein